MRKAHAEGCSLVFYPETALTTFSARWLIEDQEEIGAWFEHDMPSAETQPLFEAAKR